MKKYSDISVVYKRVHAVTFWVSILLGVAGNVFDVIYLGSFGFRLYCVNFLTVAILLAIGLTYFSTKKNIGFWYATASYTLVANSWYFLVTANYNEPNFAAFFLRETIIVALLILCVGLVAQKIHSLILGTGYIILLLYIAYISQNAFINQNLALLLFTFSIYSVFSYYLVELLRKAIVQINEQNTLICDWNIELHNNNNLLREQQQQIEEQKEELESLVETVKQRNNELNLANQTKDKFFNIIAHDLRNPAGAIEGFAGILYSKAEKLDDSRKNGYIEIIFKASTQLKNLLENLLQWTRTQTGRVNVNPVNFQIDRAIKNAIYALELSASQKQIKLSYLENAGLMAFADPQMIETVVRNLIANAIKYSYRNSEIKIELVRRPNELEITINDSGTGISQDKIRQIISKQADISEAGTENESGTGLGLQISMEFIKLNQGKFWIENNPMGGASFGFTVTANQNE